MTAKIDKFYLFFLFWKKTTTTLQLLNLTTKNSDRNTYYHDKITKMQLFTAGANKNKFN